MVEEQLSKTLSSSVCVAERFGLAIHEVPSTLRALDGKTLWDARVLARFSLRFTPLCQSLARPGAAHHPAAG